MNQQHFNIIQARSSVKTFTNEIVKQAITNKDSIEKSALHVSNLFQNKTFSNDERDDLMQMLLKFNTMSIRQDNIIKKELKIGDDYLLMKRKN